MNAGPNSAKAKRRSSRASVVNLDRPLITRGRMRASSALLNLLDARLRLIERVLRLLLADQRRLDFGAHRLSDRGPLGNTRTPFDVRVLLERRERGLDEVHTRILHRIGKVARSPQRCAIDARALCWTRELPRRARLRLCGSGPRHEQPRRFLLLLRQ